jgi:hypothetical protein
MINQWMDIMDTLFVTNPVEMSGYWKDPES